MATVTVTKGTLIRANEVCADAVAPSSFSASDTVKIPATDKNLIIEIIGAAAGNVVFSQGTGIAGVADLTVAVAKDKSSFIELDTNAYAQVDGDNKGYIIMTPAIAGTISVINAL